MLLLQLCRPRCQFQKFSSISFCKEAKHFSYSRVVSSLLDFCSTTSLLRLLHARLVLHGLHHIPSILSNLICRYADLGCIDASLNLVDSSLQTDLPYTSIIRAQLLHGDHASAFLLYRRIIRELGPLHNDGAAFSYIFESFSDLWCLEHGKMLHCHAIKLNFTLFSHVGFAIMKMYEQHQHIKYAQLILEEMHIGNVVSWSTLISFATQSGDHISSLRLFNRMRLEGIRPDLTSMVNIVHSLTGLNSVVAGESIHALTYISGLRGELAVSMAILTMYSQMGKLGMARVIFDDIWDKNRAVWKTMISCYVRSGFPEQALSLLLEMGREGFRPDLFTAMTCISSAADLRIIEFGMSVHASIVKAHLDYWVSISNALIDLYSKCNRLETARKVFEMISDKSIVSWGSIIKAYLFHNQHSGAMMIFEEMKTHGAKPDTATLTKILTACAHIGALCRMQNIHAYVIKQGFTAIVSLRTVLLVTYAKCGYIEMARRIFDELDSNDVFCWNSIISAYSKHGNFSRCFELYHQMKIADVTPDNVTFLGLLTVCVNSGLVTEGRQIFHEMVAVYGHNPDQEHYACMVDLFGRAGLLDEAVELIKTMALKPDALVWGPLLSACKLHHNTILAEFVAQKLVDLQPENPANYILLSNIYAASGRWDNVAKMRRFIKGMGLKKNPGSSWLEIDGVMHEFHVASILHPESRNMYALLHFMEHEIKDSDDIGGDMWC